MKKCIQSQPDCNQGGCDLLHLNNQLCFSLYAATRAITKTYRQCLGPLGLTYPQFLVLIVLWENDGVTISELGRRLMLDSGTLTPLLKRLESMGHVVRQRNKDDEREVNVWLSPTGQDLKRFALEARCFVAARLGMPEHKITELRSVLAALAGRLRTQCERADPDLMES